MLVTFRCKVYENITMFGDVALKLLKMMGHSSVVPSAWSADEIPDALTRLQHALSHTDSPNDHNNTDAQTDDDAVSLTHRALPLIKMMETAIKHHTPISWHEGL